MAVKKDDGFFPELFESNGITEFEGYDQYPVIKRENEVIIPARLVPYSKMSSNLSKDVFVHFYEFDVNFLGIRRTINNRMEDFKKCGGVITPDFSIYRDRPLIVQKMNTFLNRMIGAILQNNGVYVVVNIRAGDERTYQFCCKGAPKHSIIAVGAVSAMKKKEEIEVFAKGLNFIIQTLEPTDIIVYGKLPDSIKNKYNTTVRFHEYESECSKRHR
ncbi:MAG: DUF4417 domain-containing protein [Erysipelotrichaceae bacterium]|nr:DUF4417 domain-containing protein [Erysipelotrichaceae bacterium]